jgi:hypothetical protein
VPDLLDLADAAAAELRQGLLGEPGREADPEAAGDELEQRKPRRRVEAVEQRLDDLGCLAAGGCAEGVHHLAQGRVVGRGVGADGPDQRDRLGEVADIVVGQREELGVGPLGDQGAQHGRLDPRQVEVAGDRGKRPAPVGVGHRSEVVAQEPELAETLGRRDQALEEGGEATHAP